ncbi:glycoside hydrolase family 38 C-terminal domain-containing protein [Kutzneria buriramensis]|uniref:alpha-mannosidase n=1 Tax=Kutzneria buriramensis TaxID=1045776 RepID=A0A3E0HZT3_9PSEU|nr:glycoside hydrolase family 38 C-terminal domain-containing protein [Kutzneria buriramensis]REH51786.1 alpha-mannosidase [Kutzneria buriramensis]
MHDDRSLLDERLTRTVRQRIRPEVYGAAVPLRLEVWAAPGEPVPVAEALAAEYGPAQVGDAWGAPWATTWFRMSGTVPAEWAGRHVEAVVDLGFTHPGPGFQCEGLAYTPEGKPIKGLAPRSTHVPVGVSVAGGEDVLFYVEAAANPVILDVLPFQPTQLGLKETAGAEPIYHVVRAELAVFNRDVWDLLLDIEVLGSLKNELGDREPRRWEIQRQLDRALDQLDFEDVPGTAAAARAELAEVLARPAHASAHRITAAGHAHIDSAWLWPLRETVRKCARTFSNVTALMEDYPEFVFACSQAQQYAWMKEKHPDVWERVKAKVAGGQFVPVGGMWVESDTNMPGGEAMARQFVHGKRFFLDEFGIETQEVWLPDSFGYSAAMPQLVKLSGSRWFLTQKLSWNQINRFPHHSFYWEGIDGSQVFTHFPPVDTYNSDLLGADLARASRQFSEHGKATRSLVPFGYGDGGGGPTREMIETARRSADLEGSPRVAIEPPSAFFAAAEAEYTDAPVWSGELYLEKHRATYTTQARTKQGNRRSEHLLREAELWATAALLEGGFEYPYEQLDRLWKTVLLHQFHDILPGSSIAWVHREAEARYAEVAAELEGIISGALSALAGSGEQTVVFNAAPHSRSGVPGLGAGAVDSGSEQPVTVDGLVLDNGLLRVTVDEQGLITSVRDLVADREVLAPGAVGNLLQLHVDVPNQWDAWDVDPFYRNNVRDLVEADEVVAVDEGKDVGAIRIRRTFNRSTLTQVLRLRAGERRLDVETEVDWQETEKFLKVAFPVDVHADRSTSEIQFGHLHRPTHVNTSWDAAKFEICAHRWVHVAEPGYGVAVVNDSTYGHDITRRARSEGGTTTTVRLSLLRAPRFPDPLTDQGLHKLNYSLVPGAAIADAVREGYRINLPERQVSGAGSVAPVVTVDHPGVVVEAVKAADDRSGDIVVRLYEALGGRAKAVVTPSFAASGVRETDLLERTLADRELADNAVTVELRPFQVLTLRFSR